MASAVSNGPSNAVGSIHHIGVWVSDMERSRRFYVEGLGCRRGYFFNEMTAEDGSATYVTNPGCEYIAVGGNTFIELLPVARAGAPEQPTPPRGLNHLAFRVADVDEVYARALRVGGRPRPLDDGVNNWDGAPKAFRLNGDPQAQIRLAFLTGPDGETIELIQSTTI